MNKIEKFMYKIFDYDKFKTMTISKKFDYLFWGFWYVLLILMFFIFSFCVSKVSAEESSYPVISGGTLNNVLVQYIENTSQDLTTVNYRYYDGISESNEYVSIFYDDTYGSFSLGSVSYSSSYSRVSFLFSGLNGVDISDFVFYMYKLNSSPGSSMPSGSSTLTFLNWERSSGSMRLYDFNHSPRSWVIIAVYSPVNSIDYSPVSRLYPTKNNRQIASYASVVAGNYEEIPESNYLALYMTRYDKDLDSLYSYWLIFDDNNDNYKLSYSLNGDNLVITFNENVKTSNFGLTSIFDDNLFNFYTPTDSLSRPDDYLNADKWNSFDIVYTDISESNYFDHIVNTIFTNRNSGNLSYLDLSIPESLTFTSSIYNGFVSYVNSSGVRLFSSISNTSRFYDYYVILSFRSDYIDLSSLYNDGYSYTDDNGDKVVNFSYFTALPYLNIDQLYEDYSNNNDIYSPVDYVNGDVNIDYIPELSDPDFVDKNFNFTEEEYITTPAVDAFDRLFSSLAELVRSETADNQTLLNLISSNITYFYNSLQSFDDPDLLVNISWLTTQLDYLYDNTVFHVPADISLATALIMAVIF